MMTYIILRTDLTPQLVLDENGMAYAIFPECRGVTYAIRDFRQDKCKVEIHSFLTIYKQIKDKIKLMRGGGYAE